MDTKFEKVTFERFKNDFFDNCNASKAMEEYVKQVYYEIVLPKRSSAMSAGYDFFSPVSFELMPSQSILIPTGIKCKMPSDCVLFILPRSGLGTKFRFVPCNLVGVIDADYYMSDNEGHIFMKMINEGVKVLSVEQGQAFCQGVILNYNTTSDDNADGVRNGGFGSSDKNNKE